MGKAVPVIFLILFLALTFVFIIPVHGAITFTPEDKFAIPEYNSQFNFDVSGSYDSASLENGTWNFTGLALDNYMLNLTACQGFGGVLYDRDVLNYSRSDGNFSVSAHNCNITITNYDLVLRFAPSNGWLNYTVRGVGNQTFNIHYTLTTVALDWKVYIDGVPKPQNEGWTITTDQWITITGANSNVSINYEWIKPPKDGVLDSNENYTLLFVLTFLFIIIMVSLFILVLNKKRKPVALHLKKNLGKKNSNIQRET